MPDGRSKGLWVVGCLALACGGATDASLDPKPESVTPNEGPSTQATAVVISGTNFLARPVQSASGGETTVDTRHRAWLGDVELQDVVWVDAQTLQATVPAGAPPGAQQLVVENALGRRGELASAFLVRPNALLQATLATGTPISVGQEATLTLTLTNPGTSPVTNVTPATPSVTATAGAPAITIVAGPTPATIASIDAGQSAAFTWTLKGTASGGATISASITATDANSGVDASPLPSSTSLMIQTPPALDSGLTAASCATRVQPSTITLALQNTGQATADIASIALSLNTTPDPKSPSAGTCTGISPAPPQTIAGNNNTVAFTSSCTPSTLPGSVVYANATVSATDANSRANVSPAVFPVSINVANVCP